MITIELHEKMKDPRAVSLALDGWRDLLTRGLCDGGIMLGWNYWVLLALVDGTPAGVLVYDKKDWDRSYHMVLGYVVPEYRRAGVFSALYAEMLKVGKEDKDCKLAEVGGLTYKGNTELRAWAAKNGFEERGIGIKWTVPK